MKKDTEGRKRSSKPAWQREIAQERIGILMGFAATESSAHQERSDRYAQLARKIGMRYNVKIPAHLRRMCKGCDGFLVPGKNCVIRTSARTRSVQTRCLRCGRVSRHPYAKER